MRPEWKGHIIRIALGLVLLVLVIYFYWPISCADLLPKEGGIKFVVTSQEGTVDFSTEALGVIERDSPEYQKILELLGKYTCHRSLQSGGFDRSRLWVQIFYEVGDVWMYCWGTDTLQFYKAHYYVVYGKGRGQEMMDALCEILQQSKEPA